jgi:hypothetical protein
VSKLVDLASHARYQPDLVGLACGKVAATRARLGVSYEEFAVALGRLLTWEPAPGLVQSWERAAAPPPGDVIAACDILAPPSAPGDMDMDDIAIAAAEVDADRLDLLAEPAPVTISSLWDELTRLAGSANRTPHDCFTTARSIRSQALSIAEHTRRPSSLSDLYLVVGSSTALMASAAFDLHRWDVSERLSQSAISYAEVTGNKSLLTWTAGLAALLANWRDEPDVALDYFRQAVDKAPSGIPKVRLRYIAARSYALLGDVVAVRQIVEDAERDYDDSTSHRDLMSDEIGGEFAFGIPRAAACVAAAWLDAGQGRDAADSAHRALAALTALPVSRQPVSQVTGARIDLATAHMMCGELDAATEIVTESVSTATMLRNASLTGRLSRAQAVLNSGKAHASPAAVQLFETIGGLIKYQSDGTGSAPPSLG